MKRLTYLLLFFLSFPATGSFGQRAARTANTMTATKIDSSCAYLSPMDFKGGLQFMVNSDTKNYQSYPTCYKIKFYMNGHKMRGNKFHGKGQKFHLKKGENNIVQVKLDISQGQTYCLRISRNAALNIIYKKIGWGPRKPTVSMNKDQVTYYVSSSHGDILLFSKIISKDGPTGDGVKVLID